MDRNGYKESIIPNHDEYTCWLCGKNGQGKMDRHEVFGGAMRDKSKALGLWVNLCHYPCHMDKIHNHKSGTDNKRLEQVAQECVMEEQGWDIDEFRRIFGHNYL